MDLGLSARRALVLGASAGLGQAVAVALAEEGARVAVGGRDPARVAAAAEQVGGVGVPGDLAAPGGAEAVVDLAAELLGG